MTSFKPNRWLLIVILLLSAFLAARSLNADILFVDEYWSLRNSGGTFGPLGMAGIWERTATLDPGGMGVLYHWLLGAWEALVGITPFSVRAYSLLTGVLASAALYRLGRDLFHTRVGVYAAALLALSAFFIDYMHEARAYTLLALLTIAAIYCYQHLMFTRQASSLWYVGLALALAALAYTHYVALAMGLVLGIYHLTQFKLTRHWFMIVLAMAGGGILFLPWLTITLDVIQRGTQDTGRQADSMTTWQILHYAAHTFSNANLALLTFLLLMSLRQWTRQALLIWLWGIVALGAVLLINYLIPFMVHLRYLLFILPAIALLLALGLDHMKRYAALLLTVWLAAGVYQNLTPDFIAQQFGQIYRAPSTGFQRTLTTLNQRAEAGDLVLWHIMPPGDEPFNLFPLDYYFVETDNVLPELRFDQMERINNSFAGGDVDYLADVQEALQDVDVIWTSVLPQLPTTQRSGVVNYVLATQYADCGTIFTQADMHVHLYARLPQHDPLTRYGDDSIALYDLGHGEQTRTQLAFVLGFWAQDTPHDTYSVGLHLFDQAGQLVRQVDFALPNQRPFACHTGTLSLADLPPGTYTARVTLYNWQTGTRLLLDDTNEQRDYQDLRTVPIE